MMFGAIDRSINKRSECGEIKVNDQIVSYFQTKTLRQEDPLSPTLFNIVVDMLTIIIVRAKKDGQVKGVIYLAIRT